MKYTQDIIAGMSRVHDSRMVHCDLKPANIMLTENRHSAKIIDFGISRGRSTIVFSDAPKSRGTVQYMAPEVLGGQKLGLSCDVYSFGVLLYELWSGEGAWENYSEEQIRAGVRGEARPSNREQMLEGDIPAPIAALIEACWKQKPGERPTFREMQAILEIEDFWEAPESRWPSFLQSSTGYSSPVTPFVGTRLALPTAAQFEQFGCDALCQALQTQDIHEDILSWLKEKKYNGRQFVQAGAKMVEQLKSGQKADELHIEDFEQVHQRVYAQYQEELQKAQVRAEATKKAQLAAEKQAAEKRVAAALASQQALIQRESEQRGPIQSEEARLRQELQQHRTSVGQEVARRVQEALRLAEEARRTEAAKQARAKEEAEKAAAQKRAQEAEAEKRRLAQEQADSNRKAEETKRAEAARQEAERARLAAASRPAANVARTTAMTADPLRRAGNWYNGPREAQPVRALEWELGRKGSKSVTFQEAQAYAASRSAEGWRLPTVWELDALYQQRSVLGGDFDKSWFWSDTAVVGFDGIHWLINFSDGVVHGNLDDCSLQVRLVRG